MAADFPFSAQHQGPWLSTAADDMTLAAPTDDLASWSEWMQYNPDAAAPAPANKINSIPNSMHPASLSVSASMYAPTSTVPFSFGQPANMPTAFDFAPDYSPPMWQQQHQQHQHQHQHQQHQNQHHQHQHHQPIFSPSQHDHAFASSVAPASTPSLHLSPASLHNDRTSSTSSHSSPEPATSSKKRKSPSEADDDDDASDKRERGQPPKKTAHNMIEKRYRTNLNDKIAALRDSVPSLRVMSRPNGTEEDDDPEDLEGLTPAHKLNKATVLSKATEYIRHLEKRNKRLVEEVATLKGRIESYEKMAISGPITLHGPVGTPDGARYQDDAFAHAMVMSAPPQGMIPVPDNIAALQRGLPPQQHYAHAYPPYAGGARPAATGPPMVNGRRTSAILGKLMVGSLASLMILEGLVEREQSREEPGGRGLFALPINLAAILAPRASFGATTAQIPLAKVLLVFGAFFYLIVPMLDFKTKPKKKTTSALNLRPVPSLAAPVEVRRKAWLTAIQTVWVPQHNFILEFAALGLKTLKLSMRRIIGWQGYAQLTGITKEQEAARVKAWNIALDAQLAGGDAEISKSRLVLSLMASGTLPDTPARLMLKALHIRVLLWEIADKEHGGWWMADELSAKLARIYWNAARSEHRIAANTASKLDPDAEPLPEHLAVLIERECDEVLIPSVVQRAYNLAWNRPSAEKTTVDASMDGVVEDFAISSPLDALAAWHSSFVLNKGLVSYLTSKSITPKDGVLVSLDLALRTAPPNSQAHLRALVAHAVVLETDREAHITTALAALPSSPSATQEPALIHSFSSPTLALDVRKALTLAKCLSLVSSSSVAVSTRATIVINATHLPESAVTLLSFVAAHKVLTRFMSNDTLQAQAGQGLERIAGALRVWVGRETGKRSGLGRKARSRIVEECLGASKVLVGMRRGDKDGEVDDGYVSASGRSE
jgi:hypothetical protein